MSVKKRKLSHVCFERAWTVEHCHETNRRSFQVILAFYTETSLNSHTCHNFSLFFLSVSFCFVQRPMMATCAASSNVAIVHSYCPLKLFSRVLNQAYVLLLASFLESEMYSLRLFFYVHIVSLVLAIYHVVSCVFVWYAHSKSHTRFACHIFWHYMSQNAWQASQQN